MGWHVCSKPVKSGCRVFCSRIIQVAYTCFP
jgi:hypothetical protein